MKLMIKFALIALVMVSFLIPTNSFAQDATSEGESVLQKIKEKVEAIRENPKAYIGTVTDRTENSLQIKDLLGKIQQISIGNGVSISKTGKSTTDIKFSDVAIGDFVVAMGLAGNNNILDAKRILLTNPLEEPDRDIVFGKILEIQNKQIRVSEKSGAENTFSFPKSWSGPEISELDEGMNVLVVSITRDGKSTIRTIQTILTNDPPISAEDISPAPSN